MVQPEAKEPLVPLARPVLRGELDLMVLLALRELLETQVQPDLLDPLVLRGLLETQVLPDLLALLALRAEPVLRGLLETQVLPDLLDPLDLLVRLARKEQLVVEEEMAELDPLAPPDLLA